MSEKQRLEVGNADHEKYRTEIRSKYVPTRENKFQGSPNNDGFNDEICPCLQKK